MSAVFRVRKSLLGKAILQKFDAIDGVAKFRDMPFQELGDFSLVPRHEWTAVTKRIDAADKRAESRRKNRADFEASRMPE